MPRRSGQKRKKTSDNVSIRDRSEEMKVLSRLYSQNSRRRKKERVKGRVGELSALNKELEQVNESIAALRRSIEGHEKKLGCSVLDTLDEFSLEGMSKVSSEEDESIAAEIAQAKAMLLIRQNELSKYEEPKNAVRKMKKRLRNRYACAVSRVASKITDLEFELSLRKTKVSLEEAKAVQQQLQYLNESLSSCLLSSSTLFAKQSNAVSGNSEDPCCLMPG